MAVIAGVEPIFFNEPSVRTWLMVFGAISPAEAVTSFATLKSLTFSSSSRRDAPYVFLQPMETSLSPSYSLIAAAGIVIAFLLLIGSIISLKGGARLGVAGLAVALLLPAAWFFAALNPWLTDARFRAYRSFYQDLKPGMTRDEVLARVESHYPASGERKAPKVMEDTPERLGFFMDPEHSREPNCEGIFLSLREGKVVSKGYSPD